MGVYLLCGSCPDKPHVHYVGYTSRDWMDRVREHQGNQCKSTARYNREGYTLRIAAWWEDAGLPEEVIIRRALKEDKYSSCPLCGDKGEPQVSSATSGARDDEGGQENKSGLRVLGDPRTFPVWGKAARP